MLNLFPTMGRVSLKNFEISFKSGDDSQSFDNAKEALEFCDMVYQDTMLIFDYDTDQTCTYDFFNDNLEGAITFNNTDDIIELDTLENLKYYVD